MLRWFDGFEHYGAVARMTEGVGGGAAWSQVDTGAAGWSLSTANPATGSYHMRLTSDLTSASAELRRIFGAATQIGGLGYRFAVADLPSIEGETPGGSLILADIRDVSNASHITIILGTDGAVIVKRGTNFGGSSLGGTTIGRSDPCVAPGGYHHFEFKAKIDNTTGFIEIRINEVTVLNLTGVDTQSTANASMAQVSIGEGSNALAPPAGYGTFDLDDPFAWDDDDSDPENTIVDFVGDKGAYYLPPNADTATSEFGINGSVTAYGAIDEVPPNGTDYLDTGATTARTIVQVAALPGNVAEVIAFMPVIYARKEESGSVTMRGGIVSGGEESNGPDDSPSTEYAYLRPAPKTIDPDTGVPWSNIANPDLLIERTA